MTQYLVRSIVKGEVASVTRDTSIRKAAAQIVSDGAAALPVVREDGRLAGILTEKDCFRPALHASYHQEWAGCVSDYMTEAVVTVDADHDVVRAAEMFLEHPHRVFPVLDEGRLVGMLHRSEVLALLTRIG